LAAACWRVAALWFGQLARHDQGRSVEEPRRDGRALAVFIIACLTAVIEWFHLGGPVTDDVFWLPRELVGGVGLVLLPLVLIWVAVWLARHPTKTARRRLVPGVVGATGGILGIADLAHPSAGGGVGRLSAGSLAAAIGPGLAAVVLVPVALAGLLLLTGPPRRGTAGRLREGGRRIRASARRAHAARAANSADEADDDPGVYDDDIYYDETEDLADPGDLVELTVVSTVDHVDPGQGAGNDAGVATATTEPLEPVVSGEVLATMRTLAGLFAEFGLDASVVGHSRGPTVTRYKVQLGDGVLVSALTKLGPNIELALGCPELVINTPIPGEPYVGLDLPNQERDVVYLRDILDAEPAISDDHPLLMVLGTNIVGRYILANIGKLPHLLLAGSTGSGKSTFLNALLACVLGRATPEQVRLLLIDPKRVELTAYEGVPHLLTPIITNPSRAVDGLRWLETEMDCRYKLMEGLGVRHIDQYNSKIRDGRGGHAETLPYIVTIVDELADLMSADKPGVEAAIARLASLARAVGIHLILATQRPDATVITGLIKANIPARLAFAVPSLYDSKTILDRTGAEKLIGNGDGLWLPMTAPRPDRIQGAYVTDEEIATLVAAAIEQYSAPDQVEIPEQRAAEGDPSGNDTDGSGDISPMDLQLLIQAADLVVSSQHGSTSMIQRKLRLGHNRASRLMDDLEDRGVVGPAKDAAARDVLVPDSHLAALLDALRDGGTAADLPDPTTPDPTTPEPGEPPVEPALTPANGPA